MILLPVVEREMRVAARKRSTYWARFTTAALAMAFTCFFLILLTGVAINQMGMILFIYLGAFSFILALFSGVALCADSLSAEKREGTLGLLFLTDLKGFDVVGGKLAATTLKALYGLLGVVPVLGISLLLGGVSGVELGRVALALLNTLFFSAATGMLASSLCRHGRKAMLSALGILLLFTVAFPVLTGVALDESHTNPNEALSGEGGPGLWLAASLLFLSPGFTMVGAFAQPYQSLGSAYWVSLVAVHALGWVFLRVASFLAPRSWQDRERSAPVARPGRWARLKIFWRGNPRWQLAHRRRWLDINPIAWLTLSERWRLWLPWIFLGLCAGLWLLGWFAHERYWIDHSNFIFTALTLGLVFKFWVTAEAARWLGPARRSGALELILVTPLPPGALVQGYLRGLRGQFLGPLAALIAIDLLLMLGWGGWRQRDWLWICAAGIVMLPLDLVALAHQGLWQSLRLGNANTAITSTTVRVLLLPWVLYGVLMAVYGYLRMSLIRRGINVLQPADHYFVMAWLVISAGVSVFNWVSARHHLRVQLRPLASQPINRSPR